LIWEGERELHPRWRKNQIEDEHEDHDDLTGLMIALLALRQGDSITHPSYSIGVPKEAKFGTNAKVADRNWSEDIEKQ